MWMPKSRNGTSAVHTQVIVIKLRPNAMPLDALASSVVPSTCLSPVLGQMT